MNNIVIDIDDEKETIKGYDPKNAEGVHRDSAKLADKKFLQALKSRKYKKVILMCGGSASGKSEFVDSQLKESEQDTIIFDGTLSSEIGLEIKYKHAMKYVGKVEVIAIVPRDMSSARTAFYNRKRKFGYEHFLRTHAGCRKVLQHIVLNNIDLLLTIYLSKYLGGKMSYSKLRFADLNNKKEFIEALQLNG